MYTHGPAFMELHKLESEVKKIEDNIFDKDGKLVRPLSDKELDELDKP